MFAFVTPVLIAFAAAAEPAVPEAPAGETAATEEPASEEPLAEVPWYEFTSTTTVRGRFQTGLVDRAAPAVYGAPARTGLLEANERFRLQSASNAAALAGDLSLYLQTNDTRYQAVPNELFVDLAPHEIAGLNLGRRRLVYGAGFAYNPMDWLNASKDPLNPLDQRVGAYLALAEAHGAAWAVTAVYAPDVYADTHGLPRDADAGAYTVLARAYLLVAESDVNLQAGRDHGTPRAGLSFARYFFDVYEGHFEVSARQGSDQAYLDPALVRAAAGFAMPAHVSAPALAAAPRSAFVTPYAADDRWFARALAGTRYTSDSGDMLTLEYLFNGEGYTRGQWDQRIDLLRRLPAAAAGFLPAQGGGADPAKKFNLAFSRKHYLFATGQLRKFGTTGLLEDLSGNLGVTMNVEPAASALVYPSLSFRRGDHARLTAGVAVPAGSPTSEFGSLPFREQYVFETSIFF